MEKGEKADIFWLAMGFAWVFLNFYSFVPYVSSKII